MRNLIQVTCTLKVCHLLWVSNIMHGKWTFTWLYMKCVSRQASTDLVRVIVVVETDKRQHIVEVNLPGCTGRRGVWATNDLEGVCAPPGSLLPLPNALCTQDLAEVRWAEMEAGLDPARVRPTDLYGEEVNVFGEENRSLSSNQGLTPLSSSQLQPVSLSACATSWRCNTMPEVGRNVQDFFENLARGHLTGRFSVYFVQDKLIDTCKWQ